MNKFFYSVVSLFMVLFLVGCETTPVWHQSPELMDEARGIVESESAPYNCKSLGDITGEDVRDATERVAAGALRQGAHNDLRNQAVHVVRDPSKRIVLNIRRKHYTCLYGDKCDPDGQWVKSFTIKASVYACDK